MLYPRFLCAVETDMVEEGKALADKPHIVISTPGRLADHINTGTNFSLKKLRFLVSEIVMCVQHALHVFYEMLCGCV